MPLITHRGTLDITLFLARICGLYGYHTRPLGKYIAIILFRTVNMVFLFLVMATTTADFIVNIDNLGEVSYNMGYLPSMLTVCIKAYTMYKRKREFTKVLEDVHGPVTKLIKSSDPGTINLIKKSVFYQKIDFRMYLFALMLVCLTALLPIKQILNTRQLMIRAVFPFDEKPYPIFEIVYAVQYYGLMVACLWCLTFDPLVLGLVRWMTFQMDVLQSNFHHCDNEIPRSRFFTDEEKENMIEEPKAKIKSFISFTQEEADVKNDSFLLRFCECVKNHRRLIKCIDNFNDLFGVILFAEIASDCILICIGLFQLALAIKRKRNIFRDVVMLSSGLVHLGYWCVYGNLLLNEHERLLKSIYTCGWENNLNIKTKSVVVFGLYQGLTPMVMRAGYFFVFSMETYLSVVQKAYSFFALLNTMMVE